MNKSDLIPVICQEECAEVIQAISKVFRFGPDQMHEGKTNKEKLEEEVGQLLFSLYQLENHWLLDISNINSAYKKKYETHEKWYNYFPKETNEKPD